MDRLKDCNVFMPFISPGTAQRLRRRGIGNYAAFQWFLDPTRGGAELKCYALDHTDTLQLEDAAIAQVNNCEWLPAYSSDELLRICPDNMTITRLNQRGAVSYRVGNGLDAVSGTRLPDLLAEIIIRFLGRNPQYLAQFNSTLQSIQNQNPIHHG